MSDTDIHCLKEMGFSEERGKIALDATKGQGLQAAIECTISTEQDLSLQHVVSPAESKRSIELFSHPEDSQGNRLGSSDDDKGISGHDATDQAMNESENKDQEQPEGDNNVQKDTGDPTAQQPLSLVCEECGKQLKSENDVQAHAIRTGHQSFAESTDEMKPLTDEEKKEQLKKLEERMLQRRKERTEAEKQAEIQREKTRRKSGRELTEAKQKMEFEEAKRIAEQRRKEKQEEKLLRQKLKEKIAQDRLDQQARQAVLSGQSQQGVNTKPAAQTATQEPPAKKEYDACRIQFRLTDGTAVTSNFKPADALSTVYEYISSNRTDGSLPFSLMTTFPRKTYGESDMSRSLSELGLVPSAVLVLTKT